jgi:hypothetical protein
LDSQISLIHSRSLLNEKLRASFLCTLDNDFHLLFKTVELLGERLLGVFTELRKQILALDFLSVLIGLNESLLQKVKKNTRIGREFRLDKKPVLNKMSQ